jgi:hypothetical protein
MSLLLILWCPMRYSVPAGTMMVEEGTITLNLSEEEMNSLDQLALRNDMSKTAVIRKGIRIYLILEERMQRGERMFVEDELHQIKA